MSDTARTEFWRELKPIARVFQTHAMPEAYISHAATDDERYYAPLSETVGSRPLWISPYAEPLGRHPAGEQRRPREPPLPSTPGVRLHHFR